MSQTVEHFVLMGVSGCGKTTAALNLHHAFGRPVAEADDFHPEANIDKMSRGIALTDEDGVTVVSRATPEETLEAILAALEQVSADAV